MFDEPFPEKSIQAQAKATGRNPEEIFYDLLIADAGQAILIWFADYSATVVRMKEGQFGNPGYAIGLSDVGAHAKLMVDGGIYTYLLARRAKDRSRGRALPIEILVNRSTKLVADVYGPDDRGVIAVGKRADINIIDHDRLSFERPRLVGDFPGGSQRFLQDGIGYVMTVVNGDPVRRYDQDTGARPGRVARNRRAAAGRREAA
jgi:N-acyl-D-amino-acid deacylase